MAFQQILISAGGPAPLDCVDGDMAALAAHMQRCAQSRGALSSLRGALRTSRGLLFGHLVTVAFVTASVTAAVLLVARG